MVDVLSQKRFAIDDSTTGSGKTFTSAATVMRHAERVGERNKYRVYVIAPPAVRSKWEQMGDEDEHGHGLRLRGVLSYEGLRGTPPRATKTGGDGGGDGEIRTWLEHGMLTRFDSKDGAGKTVTRFKVTREFKKLVHTRCVVVVLDEFHNLKNDCQKTDAVIELLSPFFHPDNVKSRVMLLSATPFDQPRNAFSIMRVLSIAHDRHLTEYHKEKRDLNKDPRAADKWPLGHEPVGLREAYDYCRALKERPVDDPHVAVDALPLLRMADFQADDDIKKLEPSEAKAISDLKDEAMRGQVVMEKLRLWATKHRTVRSTEVGTRISFELYRSVIRPAHTLTMPSFRCASAVRSTNTFHLLVDRPETPRSSELLHTLRKWVGHLSGLVLRPPKTKNEGGGGGGYNMSQIVTDLMEIEMCKAATIAFSVRRDLRADPRCKVVVMVNYLTAYHFLEQELARSKTGVKMVSICGETTMRRRKNMLKAFNAPDARVRVLVATLGTVGTGVDLDDKAGDRPRVCYMSPSYRMMDMNQAIGRFLRADTRSDSRVHCVYLADGDKVEGGRDYDDDDDDDHTTLSSEGPSAAPSPASKRPRMTPTKTKTKNKNKNKKETVIMPETERIISKDGGGCVEVRVLTALVAKGCTLGMVVPQQVEAGASARTQYPEHFEPELRRPSPQDMSDFEAYLGQLERGPHKYLTACSYHMTQEEADEQEDLDEENEGEDDHGQADYSDDAAEVDAGGENRMVE